MTTTTTTRIVENFDIHQAAEIVRQATPAEKPAKIEAFADAVFVNLDKQAVPAARSAWLKASPEGGVIVDHAIRTWLKHARLGTQAFFDPTQGTRNAFTELLETLLN